MSVVAALLTAKTYPDVTPSLVGLAVNYTLLVPIYLNWVVKFLADMEMYMGAVERVQQYALTPTEDYRPQGKRGYRCSGCSREGSAVCSHPY
jgi:hypothetical protein